MARGNTHKASEIVAPSYGFSLVLKFLGKIDPFLYFTVFAKAYLSRVQKRLSFSIP
jgi:hypothetical protein